MFYSKDIKLTLEFYSTRKDGSDIHCFPSAYMTKALCLLEKLVIVDMSDLFSSLTFPVHVFKTIG